MSDKSELNLMESHEASNVVEIALKSSECKKVSVFRDRAEVTRLITANLRAGTSEIKITGLSLQLEENTVRVSGGIGNQKVTILEVVPLPLEDESVIEETEAAKAERQKKIDVIRRIIQDRQNEIDRIESERAWLKSYGDQIMRSDKNAARLPIEEAQNFMKFYSENLKRFDTTVADLVEKRKQHEEEIKKIEKLDKKTAAKERTRTVSVLVHSAGDTSVVLELSYVVFGAQWEPSYDARIDANQKTLQLIYYGMITNNTGDDWKNTYLALSTAEPAKGGTPPQLQTKKVAVNHNIYSNNDGAITRYRNTSANSNPLWERNDMLNQHIGTAHMANVMQEDSDTPRGGFGAPPAAVSVLTSEVQQGAVSSEFQIPRQTSIDSDKKPHKVTIGIANLQVSFTYTVIPQKALSAFLRAKAYNTSNYIFLMGPVNVFLGTNFVTKSELRKIVNPKDSFSLFCGTDAAIYVEYKEKTMNEKKGMITSSNSQNVKQTITLKSSKDSEVKVSCFCQIPLSSDGKVKVTLLNPNVTRDTNTAKLNEHNNLHFQFTLQKEKQLDVEFTIDYPNSSSIYFHE